MSRTAEHNRPKSNKYDLVRERTGLDRVAGDLTADEFIAQHIPHFFQCGMATKGYPNYIPDVDHPFRSPRGEILGTPLDTSLHILHPDRFIHGPVFHQSNSASLVHTREVDVHLIPGCYFSVMNSSRQNFNLGALVRGNLPLANLVQNGDFVWALNRVIRIDAWKQAPLEVFNYHNLTEVTRSFKAIGKILSRRGSDRGKMPEFVQAAKRLGLGYAWLERLTVEDSLVRRLSRDWQPNSDFQIIFDIKVEEMRKAAEQIPTDLRSFLDDPFPVLYIINTDKAGSLPPIPSFFADNRDQISQLYENHKEIKLRNPFVHIALPRVEGSRILAVVIPDGEKNGQRFDLIQQQIRKLNPDAVILGFKEFIKGPFTPAWKAKACKTIYEREGITIDEIDHMVMNGTIIPVLAPDIYDPNHAKIGEGYGLYALSEYHPPLAGQKAQKVFEKLMPTDSRP